MLRFPSVIEEMVNIYLTHALRFRCCKSLVVLHIPACKIQISIWMYQKVYKY